MYRNIIMLGIVFSAMFGGAYAQNIEGRLGGSDGGQMFYLVNTAGDTVAVIRSDGMTGFGTTMPREVLDVVGNVIADTFKGDGSQLTGMTVDDADADPANELQNLDAVLSRGTDAGGYTISNAGGPAADNDVATKAYVDALAGKILTGEILAGTMTDERDGQVYDIVKIGDQVWMAENLNVGTYIASTGGAIHSDASDDGVIEKYAYNNDTSNFAVYGGLYDWNEAMEYDMTEGAQGICPYGWHIPTDGEWIELEMYLGMDSVDAYRVNNCTGSDVGGQLMPDGSSGFNALMTGYRGYIGGFFNIGNFAYFWSSSPYGAGHAWTRALVNSSSYICRYNVDEKEHGFCVRCIKNSAE